MNVFGEPLAERDKPAATLCLNLLRGGMLKLLVNRQLLE